MTKVTTRFIADDDPARGNAASGWYVTVETEHGSEVVRGPLSTQPLTGVVHGPFQTEQQAMEFGEELAREFNANLE